MSPTLILQPNLELREALAAADKFRLALLDAKQQLENEKLRAEEAEAAAEAAAAMVVSQNDAANAPVSYNCRHSALLRTHSREQPVLHCVGSLDVVMAQAAYHRLCRATVLLCAPTIRGSFPPLSRPVFASMSACSSWSSLRRQQPVARSDRQFQQPCCFSQRQRPCQQPHDARPGEGHGGDC